MSTTAASDRASFGQIGPARRISDAIMSMPSMSRNSLGYASSPFPPTTDPAPFPSHSSQSSDGSSNTHTLIGGASTTQLDIHHPSASPPWPGTAHTAGHSSGSHRSRSHTLEGYSEVGIHEGIHSAQGSPHAAAQHPTPTQQSLSGLDAPSSPTEVDIMQDLRRRPRKNNPGSQSSEQDRAKARRTPQSARRKEQNRQAQRAFRERKEQHVRNLEAQIDELNKQRELTLQTNQELNELLTRLQRENLRLRQNAFGVASASHGLSSRNSPLTEPPPALAAGTVHNNDVSPKQQAISNADLVETSSISTTSRDGGSDHVSLQLHSSPESSSPNHRIPMPVRRTHPKLDREHLRTSLDISSLHSYVGGGGDGDGRSAEQTGKEVENIVTRSRSTTLPGVGANGFESLSYPGALGPSSSQSMLDAMDMDLASHATHPHHHRSSTHPFVDASPFCAPSSQDRDGSHASGDGSDAQGGQDDQDHLTSSNFLGLSEVEIPTLFSTPWQTDPADYTTGGGGPFHGLTPACEGLSEPFALGSVPSARSSAHTPTFRQGQGQGHGQAQPKLASAQASFSLYGHMFERLEAIEASFHMPPHDSAASGAGVNGAGAKLESPNPNSNSDSNGAAAGGGGGAGGRTETRRETVVMGSPSSGNSKKRNLSSRRGFLPSKLDLPPNPAYRATPVPMLGGTAFA